MKKLLIGLCICLLAACNNASKEEVAIVENDKGVVAVENDKKSVTNMENKKDVERVYYEMNSCGAVEKAVLAGDTQAVKRLLVAGAEEGDKFCALHSVIEQGFIDPARVNIEIVKLLLNAHTNVNARLILPTGFIDNSLLEKATLQRSASLVQLLLAAGASMESKDRALSLAIREDYVEIVKLILAAGVDNTVKEKAISYATQLQRREIAQLLAAGGVKPKAADLIAAADGGNVEIVRILLKDEVSADYKRKALFQAIEGTHVEIVKLLLESGVDITGHKKNNKPSQGIQVYDVWKNSALEEAVDRQEQIQESKKYLEGLIRKESDPNCLGCGPGEEDLSRLSRLREEEENIAQIIALLKQVGAKE